MLTPVAGPSRLPTLGLTAKRLASSKAKARHDAKMRALISIYHQSDRFISPENLENVIDETFAPKQSMAFGSQISQTNKDAEYNALASIIQKRKEAPKFLTNIDERTDLGEDTSIFASAMGAAWKESPQERMRRVREALLGTNAKGQPSWEVLKENAGRVRRQVDEDAKEHARSSQ
ncbi:hypothetical protein CONPUDRAFT_136782 [Coniophora puteana RWD-64-598 SS2]|uniref:Uncharacterized protein n=1 Tax=Coniophora puteana (strain RWD-64-598) TaxID=741705 RepID=A0A5M3MU67_CONPW|nr:uncharacterized protein CONPUDRAFT_136782 [Coniophora puteana RWD-64-598 SS2]EIW82255.1 hypothetical protein CONPUDRAFT_136782 [Coniophora puteana RWD-64-598 SS2]